MMKFSAVALIAFFVFAAAARVSGQEPTATSTVSPSSTPVAQLTTIPTPIISPTVEAPPEPTCVRLFLLGSYARLEWDFAAAPDEGFPQGFELRILTDGQPGPTFIVGGDVRAFDFPPEYLPRCGGPRLTFGVAAFVTAGRSEFVEDAIVFSSDCHPTIEDPAPPVAAGGGNALQPPDAGAGMRNEDWSAVTVIASIALVGLLCIALGVSVEPDRRRR